MPITDAIAPGNRSDAAFSLPNPDQRPDLSLKSFAAPSTFPAGTSRTGFRLYIPLQTQVGSCEAAMAKLDRDEEVRRRAYFLWENAGRPSGMEHHFWAEAAREIEGEAEAGETPSGSRSVAR